VLCAFPFVASAILVTLTLVWTLAMLTLR
jgi:hypothetical protein